MSDTPETDAALYPMDQVDIVWPEFARKLERERDEARRERKRAREDADFWHNLYRQFSIYEEETK